MPEEGSESLFRAYAVLMLAKGRQVSLSDVHNAWSNWKYELEPSHRSLVMFERLPHEVRMQDQVYATAIHRASDILRIDGNAKTTGNTKPFVEVLFPSGVASAVNDAPDITVDLYKVMVDSSERLVGRRQAVNTFFLTANGALVTAYGVIVKSASDADLAPAGVFLLAVIGVILSGAWKSLITSFGQLNAGKFKVINFMELYLPAAIYDAEWVALGEGKDPKIYTSFTAREKWVPNSFLAFHSLVALFAVLAFLGFTEFSVDQLSIIWGKVKAIL